MIFNLQTFFYILIGGFVFGFLWSIHNKLHDILQELRYLNAPKTQAKPKAQKVIHGRVPLGARVYVNTPTDYDDNSVVY